LQRCRNIDNKGKAQFLDKEKTQPLARTAACEDEYRTAKNVAKAGDRARKLIAKEGREKCTDAFLATLASTCANPANTVEVLIDAAGSDGCIIDGHRAQVDGLIEGQY
jgi:hypothetical protein